MEEKKKSKKGIIIAILIVIIIILLGVSGFFGYQYWKNNQSTGTEWGDIYVKEIKEISDKLEKIENYKEKSEDGRTYICGLPSGSKDISATFLDTDKKGYPELVLFYTYDDINGFTITYIDDNGEFDHIERDEEFQLLYDLEKGQYDYYYETIFGDDSEKWHSFDSIAEIRETSTNIQFKDSKMETDFKDRFVKVDMPEFETFDITSNMNESQIKKEIKKVTKNYKSLENSISKETKEKVKTEVAEINEKKNDVVEENTENGILVDGNLLKYGKYEGTVYTTGKTYTLIINSDKTYEIELPVVGLKKGNVTVEETETYDGTKEEHVVFGDDYWGIVTSEGNIQSQSEIDFHYVGEATETTQNQSQTEDKEQDNQETAKDSKNETDGEIDPLKMAEEAKEQTDKALKEEEKKLEESSKQIFNIQFETMYKGKQNGEGIKSLLMAVISSNEIEDRKITVEMDGISTADATQIGALRNKVAAVKSYEVSFEYDSDGYINKAIIK